MWVDSQGGRIGRSPSQASMAAVIMLPLLLERAGAQQESGMLFSVNFPNKPRNSSIAIAMLPEQALKIRHRGRLLRDERTEETRMLQSLAEANQVDLYLTHMTCMMTRLNDADPELFAANNWIEADVAKRHRHSNSLLGEAMRAIFDRFCGDHVRTVLLTGQ